LFGVDRQVYYRKKRSKQKRQDIASQVVELVREIRQQMPRVGTRKLYYLLEPKLKLLSVGRDRLFRILKANHLLIIPKRSYRITTNSHHRFRKHKNLIEQLAITRPEQVWVCDITYLGNRENPCYLSLVTDAYSKLIVGYNVSENLNTESCIKALEKAVKSRQYRSEPLIHHSDKGIQYCSNEYQKILFVNDLQCSMTESYDPYQNAVAERVNGILKQEFMIDEYRVGLAEITQIVKESISIYNTKRPHYSSYMLTPRQMHNQQKIKIRTYKKNSCKKKPATVLDDLI
jgi:transposase InsO family protein